MNRIQQDEFFDFYYWYENNYSAGGISKLYFVGKDKKTSDDKYLLLTDELNKHHIYMQYQLWKRKQEALRKQQEAEQIAQVEKVASQAMEDVLKDFKFK